MPVLVRSQGVGGPNISGSLTLQISPGEMCGDGSAFAGCWREQLKLKWCDHILISRRPLSYKIWPLRHQRENTGYNRACGIVAVRAIIEIDTKYIWCFELRLLHFFVAAL